MYELKSRSIWELEETGEETALFGIDHTEREGARCAEKRSNNVKQTSGKITLDGETLFTRLTWTEYSTGVFSSTSQGTGRERCIRHVGYRCWMGDVRWACSLVRLIKVSLSGRGNRSMSDKQMFSGELCGGFAFLPRQIRWTNTNVSRTEDLKNSCYGFNICIYYRMTWIITSTWMNSEVVLVTIISTVFRPDRSGTGKRRKSSWMASS